MKDFQSILEDSSNSAFSAFPASHHHAGITPQPPTDESLIFNSNLKNTAIKYASPFLLSILTGPLTTVAMLLQVTEGKLFDSVEGKSKTQPMLEKHIRNGLFGDNRIYSPPTFKGYR